MEAEIDLSGYVAALARAWKLIALGALVGLLGGLAASSVRTTEYEASTTISVDGATPQTAGMLRVATQGGTIVSETLDELALNRPPASLTPQAFAKRHVQIDPVAGSNLFSIKVRLDDPTKAAAAANLLAAKVVAAAQSIAANGARTRVDQLKSQIDLSARRLRDAEQALLEHRREARLEVLKAEIDRTLKRRPLLDAQGTEKLNELYAREAELAHWEMNYDVAKSVYVDLSIRYEESRLATSGTVQIVDAAVPPALPVPRRRVQSMAVGFAAGVLVATLLALLRGPERRPQYPSMA